MTGWVDYCFIDWATNTYVYVAGCYTRRTDGSLAFDQRRGVRTRVEQRHERHLPAFSGNTL